jgi:DUF1680 family protein
MIKIHKERAMKMRELRGKSVALRDGEYIRRERENREYLMSLKNEHLLLNYNFEAGRYSGRGIETDILGGWEAPTCQLHGHFLGHWLSAAAMRIEETGDAELKAKADAIVSELAVCQRENGNGWCGPIPEKYLYWIGRGKNVWAPQYTMHKLFMGLVDMYLLAGNEEALRIADALADWFCDWSGKYDREAFDRVLDFETGGMLEIWAELLAITGAEKYKTLLSRYYRRRLFDPLLEGVDVLTNMHANTTIPEILGCARAYEVTGEQRWYDIVRAYWKCAVDDRGMFVTGGQTQGEVWTPKFKFKARLGDKNQEHCTVYNMMRLAEFLFRHTGAAEYQQYIEYNLRNGVMAQTYFRGMPYQGSPGRGLLTYFLPLKAASRKEWAGERDSFFCCHGTMVQANAAFNRGIWYENDGDITLAQYISSDAEVNGVRVILREDYMNGLPQTSSVNDAAAEINMTAAAYENRPPFRRFRVTVKTQTPKTFALFLRVPEWVVPGAAVSVNGGNAAGYGAGFAEIRREWSDGDTVTVTLPLSMRFVPLPDDPTTGAFRYGPDVLAGVCDRERILYINGGDPTAELSPDTEREWGTFRIFFRTENQDPGINFKRICDIGYEPYQVYFKIARR